MKYREFVPKYDKIEDNVYEGFVINSSFGGRFYFSDIKQFEQESIKFIDEYYPSLMERSDRIDLDIDSEVLRLAQEYCTENDIEIDELLHICLTQYIDKSENI